MIGKFLIGCVGAIFAVAFGMVVCAGFAWAVTACWNYLCVHTNHPGSQITFWVTGVGMLLAVLVLGFLRGQLGRTTNRKTITIIKE